MNGRSEGRRTAIIRWRTTYNVREYYDDLGAGCGPTSTVGWAKLRSGRPGGRRLGGRSAGRLQTLTRCRPPAATIETNLFNSPSVVAFDSAVIGLRGDGVGAATLTPGCGCEVSKDTILTCTRKLAVKPA